MTVANDIVSGSISNSGLINFRITMQRLLELLDLEEEDDYGILRPTEYAFRTAVKLVVEAYDALGDSFAKGGTATNELGGIFLDWKNREKDCSLHLFCPSSPENTAYIYHQKSDEYGSEDVVSGLTLVHWLKWFNEA